MVGLGIRLSLNYSAGQVWESPRRRTDVSVNGILENVIPKDGVKYRDQYQEDWYVNTRPKVQKEILKALGGR
jgi:hypothetical protein